MKMLDIWMGDTLSDVNPRLTRRRAAMAAREMSAMRAAVAVDRDPGDED